MLNIVNRLLQAWHERGVRYCHWKSNADLERGLTGSGDLDVLVSQADADLATCSLIELRFKRLVDPIGKGYAGVEHWIGYSDEEGAIAHLHLHFRLVYGEKFVKSYRLPAEEEILDRRILDRGVYQISRADELIFLFIRTILKTDIVWTARKVLGLERAYFPSHILEEYTFLRRQTSREELVEAATRLLPGVDEDIVAGIDSISSLSAASIYAWKRTLRARLSRHRRLPRHRSVYRAVRAYTEQLLQRFLITKRHRRTISTGGLRIALLGADGAGKSSMVAELSNWLGRHVDMTVLYAGSGDGPKSPLLRLLDSISLSIRPGRKDFNGNSSSVGPGTGIGCSGIRRIGRDFRAIVIAIQRERTVRLGTRLANNGTLVIFDRFPQPFQKGYGDGPKLFASHGRLSQWLNAWEARVYSSIYDQFPERCIVLKVDPSTSISRKGQNTASEIDLKNAVLNRICIDKPASCNVIDANMEYAVVLREIKGLVWSWL